MLFVNGRQMLQYCKEVFCDKGWKITDVKRDVARTTET